MNPVECEFEADVLAAVIQGRWPECADFGLREHAAGCAICADVALVAGALSESCAEVQTTASVPDSGRVWWVAQMRARREDARAAGRPITAAQVLAFACAMGLLGACFGATSAWFQAGLFGVNFEMRQFLPQLLAMPGTALSEHALMAALVFVLVLVVPGAVYWVVARD